MQTINRFIAGICAILFIFTGVIALLFFNIERKAFSSETYKQAFEKQNLYQRMPGILANVVTTVITQNPNLPTFVKTLTVANWESTILSVLPPQEVKAITDQALDSIFNYINRRSDSVVISVLPLKSHLIGPAGVEVVRQVLRAQPACTPEQLQAIALGFLSGGDILLCSPPEDVMVLLTPVIESQIQVLSVAIPDQITLVPEALSGTPNDPRPRLNNLRLILLLSPFLPVIFLIAITIFAVRDLKGWLNWWGWPLMLTGMGSLLLAWLGSPVVGLIVRGFIQIQGARFIPPILLSTLQETASSVTSEILYPVAIGGLILAVLGFTMAVAALFVVRRNTV
ncbi:MAG TPA: hypothetical protein VJM08_04900 [Anaerolineales bacterium]|nr:hypothetical protein [Anaerolineales bacterium]